LRPIPKDKFAQGTKIFATVCDGEKMIAGKLADFAGKLYRPVSEQDFGFAQPAGIKNDVAGSRVAGGIFMSQPKVKAAQRDPTALSAPAYVNYLLPVGEH